MENILFYPILNIYLGKEEYVIEQKFLRTLGERLQIIRKSCGLSQEMLAELTDLHPTHISMMERGVINSSISNLHRISKAMKLTLPELLDIPSKKESEKDLILNRIIPLLRKQNLKTLSYIEKSINVFIEFTKQ